MLVKNLLDLFNYTIKYEIEVLNKEGYVAIQRLEQRTHYKFVECKVIKISQEKGCPIEIAIGEDEYEKCK